MFKIMTFSSLMFLSGMSMLIAKSASAQVAELTYQEPFSDTNGSTISELASYEGITAAEAEQRLRSQSTAAATSYVNGGDHFNEIATADITPLSGGLGVADTARRVRQDREILADAGIAILKKAGIDATIEMGSATDPVAVLSTDPDRLKRILKRKNLSLPEGLVVRSGDPIMPTATQITWSGGSKLNSKVGICTAGFGAIYLEGTSRIKGMTTAKHCGYTNQLDLYSVSAFQPSAFTANVERYVATVLQDLQFAKFVDQNNNFSSSLFNDGASKGGQVVRGGIYARTGTFLCKYGRSTGRTCGYVEFSTYRNGDGTFFKVSSKNASAQKPLAKGGDSGGPVFLGNLMAGQVYGVGPDGSMYFSPSSQWKALMPNLRFYCGC